MERPDHTSECGLFGDDMNTGCTCGAADASVVEPPDTVDVPLFAEDFDLIDRALHLLRQIDDLGTKETADAIAELRDRLKRARLLP